MVLALFAKRHQRCILRVFDGLPDNIDEATNAILAQVGTWMAT